MERKWEGGGQASSVEEAWGGANLASLMAFSASQPGSELCNKSINTRYGGRESKIGKASRVEFGKKVSDG